MNKSAKNILVIGDGGWGTALAITLCKAGHHVTVWGPFHDYICEIQSKHENLLYLPGVKLPPKLAWTSDAADACRNAEMVVAAVPTRFYRTVLKSFRPELPANIPILSVAKGFDPETRHRMSEVLAELGFSSAAVLSGPSHAEEVAREVPTAVTVAALDPDIAKVFQGIFPQQFLRIYTSTDIRGVELGGALKNVIAIAVGVSDGLGFGDNTRAALITRGLVEVTRLGIALGAASETFAGLSGLGDLIVTCTSRHSRNRAVGERLGKGESMKSITDSMKQVAEGVCNCSLAAALAREHNVPVPITDEVEAVIHRGKSPRDAVQSLLMRDPKSERQ
jgi:glycerol-3-phosphate dehydrogenase (NAD(P)+)